MNRYTRLTPARYTPRSMQEMMMLPMMRRQQHDQSIASAVELGKIDTQTSTADKEVIDRVKGEYEGSINEYVESLNRDGFNNESTQGIINLSKKKKELAEKYLNPSAANLAAMQAYKKEIMASKDWSPQDVQKFAAQNLGSFKGTFNEDGSTNTFQGAMLPTYVEAGKRIDDAIANIGEDTKQSLMQQYGTHNFNDLMQSTKISGKSKEKILQTVAIELQGDTRFLNSYKAETSINGLQEFDGNGQLKIGKFSDDGTFIPESRLGVMLYGKAVGASSNNQTHSFTNIKDDMALHNAKALLEAEQAPGRAYTSLPVQREELRNKGFFSALDNIANGKHLAGDRPLAPRSDSVSAQKDYLDQMNRYNETGGKGEAYSLKHLNEEDRTRFSSIFDKLKQKGIVAKGTDLNSKEAASAVRDYLKEYESVTFSNTLIRPSKTKPGSLDQALLYDKDITNASKMLTQDIKAGLVQMWDEQGNPVDREEIYETLESEKLDYLGVISPNNHIDNFKESGQGQTIMPHMVSIQGKRYYVGRQDSELKTPEYKAASTIKQATFEGARQPGLAIEHDVANPTMQASGISGLQTTYNAKENNYNISITFADGKVWTPPEGVTDPTTFNEIIYGLYDNDLTNEAWKK